MALAEKLAANYNKGAKKVLDERNRVMHQDMRNPGVIEQRALKEHCRAGLDVLGTRESLDCPLTNY